MTEDAKTENHTAGGPCGAYIELPCKFAACRDIVEKIAFSFIDIFRLVLPVETVCLLSNTKKKKESFITLDVEMEDYCRIKNEGKISGHRQVSLTIEQEFE